MIDEKKKMTAQGSSVGADDGQSISQTTKNSIPTSGEEINDEIVNSPESLEEMYRRMQRMADPRYLHKGTCGDLRSRTGSRRHEAYCCGVFFIFTESLRSDPA